MNATWFPDDHTQFLTCELKGTVSSEQNCTSVPRLFPSQCCTLAGSSSVANASPQDLTNSYYLFLEHYFPDTIAWVYNISWELS